MARTVYFVLMALLLSGWVSAQESTATSNVHILEKTFEHEAFGKKTRKVWIYLPSDYADTQTSYPVIYMHDGQNLFDKFTSFAGEWEVDETLNRLNKEAGKGFIVVGIENGGMQRINEYTPWPNAKYGGGEGAAYVDFIVEELKPYIDKHYRTKHQARNTAVIGSSLGGLISYYAGLKYPSVFGKIGALSPSFWYSDEVYAFTRQNGKNKRSRLFMLVGSLEGESVTADAKKVQEKLLEVGFPTKRIHLKIVPEGAHNEAFWSGQFEAVIKWLFALDTP